VVDRRRKINVAFNAGNGGRPARALDATDVSRRVGLPCRYTGCRLIFRNALMATSLDALMHAADRRNDHELAVHGAIFSGPIDRHMVTSRTGGAPAPHRRAAWVGRPR
jgi:hypothetical protein